GLFRFTVDFRYLNEFTEDDAFPLPRISQLIDFMSKSGRFSVQDIPDAFHSVEIGDGKGGHLTAFALSSPTGHYEFLVMPMGFKNSPAIWCRIMEMVYKDIPLSELVKYIDDTCNHVNDFIEHLISQRKFYKSLEAHNMIVKPSKSHLNCKQVKMLGYIVSEEGRSCDPSLVKDILKIDKARDLAGVQAMCGLINAAREFVPNLSALMEPIFQLAGKGVNVEATWDDEIHGKALQLLKKILTSEPVLILPDNSKKFHIVVDACRVGRGFGAILMQKGEDEILHPVAYWSRSLLKAERNYSATDLECTAMHDAILHWSQYLRNFLPFDITTDHNALVYMVVRPKGDPNGRLARLCLDLQQFRFSITYRKGSDHIFPDAVSRLFQKDDIIELRTEDILRDDIGPLSVEEKNFLEKEYPQDFPFLIKSTEERRSIEQEKKDTFKIRINSIGYHRLNVSFQNSANIQTNFQKLKLWNNHLKNLEEVTKALELQNFYSLPSVIETIQKQYPVRRWHPTIRVLLDYQIASCKHNDIPDALFILFGNHPFALPQLLSTQFIDILNQINLDHDSNSTFMLNSFMQPELANIIIDYILSQSVITSEDDFIVSSFINNNAVVIQNLYTPAINVSKEQLAMQQIEITTKAKELSKRQKKRKENIIQRLILNGMIPPDSKNIDTLYEDIKNKNIQPRRKGYQQSKCKKFDYLVR
ncbi:MAG: reverse transcriptase family protein, partial [Pseudomonadota bacterium]